jgi:hypothetical protein
MGFNGKMYNKKSMCSLEFQMMDEVEKSSNPEHKIRWQKHVNVCTDDRGKSRATHLKVMVPSY